MKNIILFTISVIGMLGIAGFVTFRICKAMLERIKK